MRACLLVVAVLLPQVVSAQTITMSFPQSTTYINSVPVQWSISPTTQIITAIEVTFTYAGGYYANTNPPPVTFTLASTATTGRFTFVPLLDVATVPNANFSAVSPAGTTTLLDGTYTVRMRYVRSDGAVLSSSTASMSLSTITLPPTLSSPADGQAYAGPMPISYRLPSTPRLSGTPVQLRFEGPTPLTLHMSSATTVAFDLDPQAPLANNTFVRGLALPDGGLSSGPVPPLDDGTYSVTLEYVDSFGHPAASTVRTNVVLRNATPAPVMLAPSPQTDSGALVVSYQLPVAPLPGSVRLTLSNAQGAHVFALPDSPTTHTFTLAEEDAQLPDGTYTLTLSYRDALGNAAASASVADVRYQFHTLPPTLSAPSPGLCRLLPIQYALPQAPLPGSVRLHLSGVNDGSMVLADDLTAAFLLDPAALRRSPEVLSTTPADLTLVDGLTEVTLSYRDTWGHAAVGATRSCIIKTATRAPVVEFPRSGERYGAVPLRYALPDAPAPGSVVLTFAGPSTVSFVMADQAPQATLFLDPTSLPGAGGPFVSRSGAATLERGMYTVVLSYQDSLSNAFASSVVREVVVETPVIAVSDVAVREGAGAVSIPITLSGAHSQDVTVAWETVGGSAVEGRHFSSTRGTVTWAAGVEGEQQVTVSLVDDQQRTGPLTFSVQLSAPTHATLGARTAATVTVLDAQTASVVRTEADGETRVREGEGSDTFTLVLSSKPAAEVRVTMSGGSLVSLEPSTVVFGAEDWATEKTVTVRGPPQGSLAADATAVIATSFASDDPFYAQVSLAPLTVTVEHPVPPVEPEAPKPTASCSQVPWLAGAVWLSALLFRRRRSFSRPR